MRVLVALVLAIFAGALIAASGSASFARAAEFIAPLGTLWVNAIRMTVIPLVVSLIIIGVASAANVGSVGRIGGRTLLVFFLLLAGTAAVVVPAAVAISSLLPPPSGVVMPAGAAEAASEMAAPAQAHTLSSWVAALLPSNPIAAAASGAMMPLILFTLLLALAIARTPEESRGMLTSFFRALSDALLILVRWVILLAPIGVFALVLPLAVQGGAALAGAIGLYVAVYSLGCVVLLLLLYVVVGLTTRISLRRFARAAFPAQAIAFSSTSSLAALPALFASSERELGLPARVSGFVLPLAASIFKVATPLAWTIGALFAGWFYGKPLNLTALATVAFAAVFLSIALPGVPRGAFIMLTPVFLAVGLPVEAIGILIAVDAIPDAFVTVVNTTGYLASAAIVGRRSQFVADEPVPSTMIASE